MKLARAMMIAAVLLALGLTLLFLLRVPLLILPASLLVLYRLRQRPLNLTSHGSARWATAHDARKAGMLGGGGLPLGHMAEQKPGFWKALNGLFDRRIPSWVACLAVMLSMRKFQLRTSPEQIRLNRVVHTAIFAPTGAGKGVSLVIPFLLECPDSCVVIDFKGENARLTAEARKAMGHEVVILDPYMVVTQTPDAFNPLSEIDSTSRTALDECRDLAEALVIRHDGEKEPHWNDSAEEFIAAMSAAVVGLPHGGKVSMQSVRDLLVDVEQQALAIREMKKSPLWERMLARMGHKLEQFTDKELASVLTTANRHTRFLDSIPVADCTHRTSFDPKRLRTGKMTVYLVLPPEHMRAQAGLLRMWIGSLLRAVVKCGLGEEKKVHFVLDEAASLGKMDALDDAVDKLRGYGVRLQFFYQSLGQLKQCWPEGKDQTLLSNTSQVFFAVNDQQTAEYVSNRLGEATIVVDSGGSTDGRSKSETVGSSYSTNAGKSWSGNANWSPQGRKLLKPEEVAALPQRVAVTFTPGVPPICTVMTRYYEQKSPGKWRRIQTTAEVWLTAMLMLLLSALGVWAAVISHPRWR